MDNIVISTTLENVCLKQNKSIISGPFGSNISSKFFVERGIPVIRGNNLTVGKEKFLDYGFVYVTDEKAKELNCYALKDDLIFTSAGTLGQVGIIPENARFKEYVISNKQIRVRIDNDIILPIYAYYWFSSPWIQKKLCDNNKGSTVPLLTLSEIKSLPIKYPKDINEQKKIVNILNSIDEQLKRNSEMVQKLQVLSQTVFNYYYSNNNKKTVKLKTIAKMYQPETITGSDFIENGKYPVYGSGGIIGRYDKYNHTDSELMISCRGLCGNISLSLPYSWIIGNQMIIKPSDSKLKYYLYNYLQIINLKKVETGSVQKQITRANLENLDVELLDENILSLIANRLELIHNELIKVIKMNDKLNSLKNTLLPLLINQQLT